MSNSHTNTSSWRNSLLALVVGLVWILAWYWETGAAMVSIWERSGTFTHAFLVPPITLWLIWRLRQPLATIAPRANLWLALPFFCVGGLWLLGELAAVNVVTQFALVAMIVLAVPMLLGMQLARAITFPLLFLFFAVPFGEFVMPTLMQWTANITVMGVRMSGVPVFQEGLQFVIPSGHWSVIEACSGVRYLIASICIGVLFAYLNYRSLKRRVLFVIAATIVPLIANWIRAYGIVMLGHVSGNKLATGVDHLVYGWVFFGIVITALFMLGMRWHEPERVPAFSAETTSGKSSSNLLLVWFVFALLVCAPRAAEWLVERANAHAQPQLQTELLGSNGGWQLDAQASHEWKPAFVNPSAELQAMFRNGQQRVGVYIAYYRQQDYSRKLISSENMLVRSADPVWAQVGRGSRELSSMGVRTATLRSGDLNGTTERRLAVWQWYWIDGHKTASDLKGKLYTTLAKLQGHGDDAAVIILFAPENQPGGAEAALENFSASQLSAIQNLLEQTRKQR
ncbi:MAG TPA: exosortase A [Rhodocyclaceae bacterium]|nr:exosortase A [Rhodocyclaceae bacterium]